MAAKRVVVEVEVPEGETLEELLGVKYGVLDVRLERLRRVFRDIERKGVKVDKVPSREEIYADKA